MPSLSGPPWYNVNPACCGSLWSQRGIRLLVLGKFCCPSYPKLDSIPLCFSRAQGWFKELVVLAQPLRTSQNVDPCTRSQNLPEATHVLYLSSPTGCQHASSPCSLMVSVPFHSYLVRKLLPPSMWVIPESVPCRRGLPTWSHNLSSPNLVSNMPLLLLWAFGHGAYHGYHVGRSAYGCECQEAGGNLGPVYWIA